MTLSMLFQNLDNLHHYLGDMFLKMKAPSFFVESETAKGNLYTLYIII